MLRTKTADRIVCVFTAFMLIAAVCLLGAIEPVQGDGSHEIGYESLLFDQGRVHTIEITMDNWDDFIANASAEEYRECTIVIDGENLGQVGIRAKGNTSLSSVATLGSTRYSFKVEFNHYVKGKKYHGLDKLSLNNLIQDATMMKDYLAYTLMAKMDVPASLCSYTQIIVNGETWGLYLAVEGVEDAFLERNGMTKGELYKPDSLSFGGGRGNGGDFDIEKFREKEDDSESNGTETEEAAGRDSMPGFSFPSGSPFGDGSFTPPEGMPDGMPQMPEGGFSFPGGGFPENTGSGEGAPEQSGQFPQKPDGAFGGFNFGMGSDDVKLVYSDDNPESYSNIFDNAKTTISSKDKDRLIASLKKLNEGEDLDSVVNKNEVTAYLAVHNFLCNDDSYTGMMVHNYYLYEEKGQLTILPWDYNLAFGGFSASADATSTVNSPIDSPVTSGTTDSRPLISWIFSDDEALAAYHEAYDRFISECVESGWLEEEITRVQEMIAPYVESDPSKFYTEEEFETAVSTLKTFCARRGESIRGQLDGTIPSTTEGQRADDSTLINAGDIATSDMGSMNNGNAPGGNENGSGGFPGGSGFSPPDFAGGSFTPPSGNGPFAAASTEAASNEKTSTETSFNETSSAVTEEAAETAEVPAEAETPAADRPAQISGNTVPEQPDGAGERPSGFPGMSNYRNETNHTGAWIQTGICAVLLLAAILVIRRFRGHNC